MDNCNSHQVYKMNSGKLKLRPTIGEITYWHFSTFSYFTKARIEIKAKFPIKSKCNKSYEFKLKIEPDDSCKVWPNYISWLGIASIWSFGQEQYLKYNIYNQVQFGVLNNFHIKVTDEKLKSTDYQVYGIEWSDSFIQWFLNDRVVYQANRDYDYLGNRMRIFNEKPCLPLDYPFKLIIDYEHNFGIDQDQNDSCDIEIDYVKIYGAEHFEDKVNKQEQFHCKTTLFYSIIAGLILLIGIMLITLVVILRRQKNER